MTKWVAVHQICALLSMQAQGCPKRDRDISPCVCAGDHVHAMKRARGKNTQNL